MPSTILTVPGWKCKFCGYEWAVRRPNPKGILRCPHCKKAHP